MNVGDILEWLAGGMGVTASYLGTRLLWVPFAVACVVVAYEAQCYGTTRLVVATPKWLRIPRRKKEPA